MLLCGVALTAVQTATATLIQENADELMQGRVFGLLGSMYSGFLPIGMAVFGPLSDAAPMKALIIGSGRGAGPRRGYSAAARRGASRPALRLLKQPKRIALAFSFIPSSIRLINQSDSCQETPGRKSR